jgi:ADP-ribosyl-[dinitrogen reductase] hydrolase
MLLNGAIGDQLGAAIEMMPAEVIRERYTEDELDGYLITDKIADRPYTTTDDTQMTIAVYKTIQQSGEAVTRENFLDAYLEMFDPFRGYGLQTYKDFSSYIENGTSNIIERTGERNGSLMRISPLIMLMVQIYNRDKLCLTDSVIRDYVRMIHYPTHMNDNAIDASMFYVRLLFLIVMRNGSMKTVNGFNKNLKTLLPLIANTSLYAKMSTITDFFESESTDVEKVHHIVTGLDGINADEALATAIFGVMLSFDTPNKILQRTRKLGGDTDTICSIAGQISGLLFGQEAIDMKLYDQLETHAKDIFGHIKYNS